MNWNNEILASVVGMLISLIFSYFPILKDKYYALTKEQQSLIMIGTLLVASLAVFGMSCARWLDVGLTCDQVGLQKLASAFILALISNQATYSITKNVGRSKPVAALIVDEVK